MKLPAPAARARPRLNLHLETLLKPSPMAERIGELEAERDRLRDALVCARPFVASVVAGDAAVIAIRCDTLTLVDRALGIVP